MQTAELMSSVLKAILSLARKLLLWARCAAGKEWAATTGVEVIHPDLK